MEKYEGRKFTCQKCGKVAYSKFKHLDNCRSCRTVAKNHSNCQKCGRKFYTTIGKTLCRFCYAIDGHYLSESYRRRAHREAIAMQPAIERYRQSIIILIVKCKWNLLNQIDIFKICHIYMECIGNENKYCNLSIDEQVQYMLLELNNLLKGCYKPEFKSGIRIYQIDKVGNILAEFRSIKSCAEHFGVHSSFVKKSCDNGGFLNSKVNRRLRFRYVD